MSAERQLSLKQIHWFVILGKESPATLCREWLQGEEARREADEVLPYLQQASWIEFRMKGLKYEQS